MEFNTPTPEINFGKEIAKAVVEGAAIVAGAYAVVIVTTYAANKFFELKDARTIKNQNKK